MWQDWVEGNNWTLIGTENIRDTYGGWFHVYAFTMTLGILLAIGYSFYKFKKQRLSADNLIWGATLIVPIALFGASFFGKLNAEGIGKNAGGVGFWGLFAFWQAGMSIHGGVLFGLIAGLVIFGFVGHKARISLWNYVDAIVPNILLGQVVGRWGNFFNHELVGAPMYAIGKIDLSSAPRFASGVIDYNALIGSGLNLPKTLIGQNTLAYNLEDGIVYQMMPIFLIESLSLLALWLIITFVVPNVGKWFGPKPWKLQPQIFNLEPINPNAPFKTKVKSYFQNVRRQHQIWDQIALNETQPEVTVPSPEPGNSKLINRWRQGQALILANNPYRYRLTRVGCEGAMYFFGWNLVRFLLEMSRPDDHLFIMFDKTLSLILIGLMAGIGLVLMVLTQIGIPQLFRTPNWVYEQNYLYKPIETETLTTTRVPEEIKVPHNQ